VKPNAPRAGSSLGRSVAAVLAVAVMASAAVTGLLYAVGVAGGLTRTVVMPSGQTLNDASPLHVDPVLDPKGQIVGIADQIASGGSGVDQGSGAGFVIPIDPVKAEPSAAESGHTVEHRPGAGLPKASLKLLAVLNPGHEVTLTVAPDPGRSRT
jgi:S1-C subfamily serine protease